MSADGVSGIALKALRDQDVVISGVTGKHKWTT